MTCGGKPLYWLEIEHKTDLEGLGMTNLDSGGTPRWGLGFALATLVFTAPFAARAQPAAAPAFYELRTYYANPGKLEALNARFRDHTLRLFEKAGMTNVAYWTKQDGGDGT